MYEWDVKHSFFMLMVSYAIMKIFEREKQHIIVFVVLYAYQSVIHVEIMIRSYGDWGAEITAFTMNLVWRLISLAMCFRDGYWESDNENEHRISKLPPFYKVLVYTFNVPSCIASPFYEYKDFEDWIELKGHYEQIPNPLNSGLKRFATGLCWMVVVVVIGGTFNIPALVSDDFCHMSLAMQSLYQFWTVWAIKYAYYIVWWFVDTGMILSGLAYDGTDQGVVKYDRYTNVKEAEVELGWYVKKMVYSWNITIQYWMKKYVYMRIVSKGEEAPIWKFFVVFLISAFWHGFYPWYYFFFSYTGIYLFLSGDVKHSYSYYLNWMPKYVQIALAYFFTTWINLYIGSSFMMFHPSDIIYHYNCQYWYGHILLGTVFILSLAPLGKSLRENVKRQIKASKKEPDEIKIKKDQ